MIGFTSKDSPVIIPDKDFPTCHPSRKAKPREGLSAVAGFYQSESVCARGTVTTFGSCRIDTPVTEERQESVDVAGEAPVHAIADIISPLRFGTYLVAAGHDPRRALELYLWNAKLGEAFHLPVQAVEVGLRNRVSDGLERQFGPDWWRCRDYARTATAKAVADIEVVARRLQKRNKEVTTGQIIAGLSFGFWVAMLDRRYNPPVWGAQLLSAFPYLPRDVSRKKLNEEVREIAKFRNRISHHEPIFKRDLSADYARCFRVLTWLCPEKAAWIRPHCRVQQVLRARP